jgi:hypothetical protein
MRYEEVMEKWHARRDSNPQHSVLETDALPIELLTRYEENFSEKAILGHPV